MLHVFKNLISLYSASEIYIYIYIFAVQKISLVKPNHIQSFILIRELEKSNNYINFISYHLHLGMAMGRNWIPGPKTQLSSITNFHPNFLLVIPIPFFFFLFFLVWFDFYFLIFVFCFFNSTLKKHEMYKPLTTSSFYITL